MPTASIKETRAKSKATGPNKSVKIKLKRLFSKEGVHPFDEINWVTRNVKVRLTDGSAVDRDLEFPEFWSESAANIAGSKYFRGRINSDSWEKSAKQMIGRVVETLRKWGLEYGYFDTTEEADLFMYELASILVNQKAAFNSPVWFNMGQVERPQCSACFILDVQDSMESILDWVKNEGMIFKGGSGAGVNLSTLRAKREKLSAGGYSSGPVAFMRGADSVAGMIASGGSTRRAAKMVVLNIDHPDVLDFIRAKSEEEKKVKALIEGGFNMYDLNNPAWNSIQYQNANNSVRVSDEFMRAVERDGDFSTKNVVDGSVAETVKARDLMTEIAKATWECGDPGMQYDTTINNWHTCPNTARINASNPCSEYMHVDNSACNLASINLLKYLKGDGTFDVKSFEHTVDVLFLAQEIIVDGSSYPTKKIEENTRNMRQIGLGYANLGALLMSMGLPYDSEESRSIAGSITALMTGRAYRQSSLIARRMGTFAVYPENKDAMLRVIGKHREKVLEINQVALKDSALFESAAVAWNEALDYGTKYGYRNAQATVLAPTGTIAFMMDCATTGIEPEFALVKTKQLVGGGTMRIVNSSVPQALTKLGYGSEDIAKIVAHVEQFGTIEGAPELKDEHLAVFDCAVKPKGGERSIHWQGHVRMVAAAQPFISGAISKTFNVPHESTIDEIFDIYVEAWRLGIKAIAIYRDGSKSAQPLQTSTGLGGSSKKKNSAPVRRRLPDTRASETHKFHVLNHTGYITYSTFEDGTLGEIFIRMNKQGSTLAGLLDQFAIAASIALQYGVPLKVLTRKFSFARFEPAGFTKNPDIQTATSITDYVFRYLAQRFLSTEDLLDLGVNPPTQMIPMRTQVSIPASGKSEDIKEVAMPVSVVVEKQAHSEVTTSRKTTVVYAGGACKHCGGMMVQTGSCKTCIDCGNSNGGC